MQTYRLKELEQIGCILHKREKNIKLSLLFGIQRMFDKIAVEEEERKEGKERRKAVQRCHTHILHNVVPCMKVVTL